MYLMGTRSLGKFLATGVVLLPGVYIFGGIAMLGALFGFDAINDALNTGWRSFDWRTDGLYLTGVGGILGLFALLVCWLAILWPRVADWYPRLLISGLVIGMVGAIPNIAWMARFGLSDIVGFVFLTALALYVILALYFVRDILRRTSHATGRSEHRSAA